MFTNLTIKPILTAFERIFVHAGAAGRCAM